MYTYCNEILIADSPEVRLFKHGLLCMAVKQASAHDALAGVDGQGSAIILSDTLKGQQICFDVYGVTPNNIFLTVGFQGAFRDRFSHLYLLGNGRRAYSTALRRFISSDSLSPFERGGINSYAFCLNDPVNRTDPTGQWSWHNIKRALLSLITVKEYKGTPLMKHDGITVFSKSGKKSDPNDKLYILGHGIPGLLVGQGNKAYKAPAVIQGLNAKGIVTKNRKIHILACYSAEPTGPEIPSFIDQMAALTGSEVVGYKNRVPVERYEYNGIFHAHKLTSIFMFGGSSKKIRSGQQGR
ncbi:RHS repeat-associated core domain protein-containing protein [Pseudomonas sp. GM84]|uniref:RHS repeat-associated core domain-containing protein n=1 Tax=Pseudomonas sp. GM84 TaxID=1144340 RepID=UPI00026FB6AE|nr:RHS repeat-associated core domain-containing protein [Pseudomonas sp. GM84]EJN30578.1 RHS repeat-associated core domain protein-containing protein [Pseudomonas sp. GM84]